MDKQIREMSKNRTWKRLLKRGVALLCAVVMLFTMNTLKRNADTLERIAMCGYAEHVHSEACYVGDALSCGMTEHIHTDACYQETPVSMGIDDIDVTMDAPAVDGISADLDLSLALDGLDLVTEDVAPEEPAANAGETGAFSLGTGALVSAIIEAVGLNVSLDGIVEVGAVENDEAHSGLLAIERVEGDYRVTARRDFDEARLALITADDVNVVRLQNGVAPVETMAVESPATGEQRAEGLSQPEDALLNEEMPEGDGQLALVDTAPVEAEQPDVEAIAVTEDDQAGDKTEIVAEEGAGEANPGTEAEALATDIAPEGDVTLPTGDEQVAEELGVVGAGDPVAQQQGEGVAEAGDEAWPAEAAVGEQGGEEEAGALFAEDDGESDAPAEEMASQEEEPTVEDGETALEEAQPAANDEEVTKEEQPAEDGGEGPALEDAAEAPAEAQNAGDGEEGQPAEDAGDREEVSEEEQPAGDGEAQLEGEEPGETSAEAQSDREPAEEAAEAQSEEDPAEEAAEAQSEEDPAEEAAEAQPGEEPAEEAAEAQPGEEPAEEAAEAQSEEDPAEESGEAQPGEEPAEEVAEAQPGEDPAEEAAEAQPGEQPAEEAEGEAPGEEADGDRSACTATIDMAQVSEYPMSLNALVAQIAPVSDEAAAPDDETVEDGEGTDEDTADETAAATSESSWTVEYDRELLEVTEDGQDCLITPVRSFESTLIVADNGGRYALTLVNCALEQAAAEEAEVPEAEQPSRPAQEFEGSTEYVRVCVSAPEGAFPEGTTMALADVEDEKTLTDIEDTVTGGFVRVERVHAVDITFFDAEGNEIEPLVPISVVMAVAEIAREEEAVVVHVDGDGAPQVVESRSEAPEGETGLKVEMPAAEAPEADGESAEAQAPESTDVPAEAQADAEATAGTGEAAVGFEADSFSVYAVVVTRTLEAKYIDARGETWSVSVGYAPEALIPDDARLAVSEVTDERYLAEAEAALEGGKRVTLARFFDISILDADGTEVQPAVPVTVNIALDNSQTRQAEAAEHVIDSGEPEVCAVHFDEEKTDIVTAAEKEEAVVFDAVSFSVWGVMYTVDFYYGDYEYHMPGEGNITLSGLFGVLGIEADATQATDVVFTNPELVAVRKVEEDTQLSAIMVEFAELNVDAELEGEAPPEAEADETVIPAGTWLLISLAPFNTEEKLTVTMEDGTVYEIRVEDEQSFLIHFLENETHRGHFELSTNGQSRIVHNDNKRKNAAGQYIRFDFDSVKGTAYIPTRAEEGSRFCMWLRQDGTFADVSKTNVGNDTWINDSGKNVCYSETTFIAYFAPKDNKLIVIRPYDHTYGTVDTSTINKVDGNDALPYYRYSGNDGVTGPIKAVPNSECFFKGWFTPDGECYSTSRELDVSAVEKDLVLTPQFGQNYKYSVIPNESGKAHFHYYAWGNNYDTDDAFKNLPTEGVPDSGICSFRFPVSTWAKDSNYEFVYWLRDDGTTPITDIGNDGKASTLRGFANQTDYNIIDRNTTYVAFYKPKGDYLIRTNWPAEGGYPTQVSAKQGHGIHSVHDDFMGDDIFWFYYANADRPVIGAIPNGGWVFEGWYHNGTELISTDANFDVYNYIYNNTEGKGRRDLNLTPVFKKTSGTFHVWFDGTNGIGGGDHSRNNTFYTRINGSGVASGTNSVLQNYNFANGSYTINSMPSAEDLGITAPMSQSDTKFMVKGWYDVYNNKYYNVGDSATITADTVFYADWGPSDYNIGQNSNVAHNLNTGNFIRTKVFDYNNLFNMSSITLDRGRSVIPEQQGSSWNDYNKEYWSMSGDSDDFIFMSTVSATGRSLNPYGRTERNQNRETSTNGTYYTAIVTQGLLNADLRNRLFSTSNDPKTNPGHTYVGSDSYLYNYDKTTGYFYYDSDKNAASYNQHDGRFYVYSYTNQTNKSDSGDKTDFLPFNYGPYNFSETYGAPNYWFGMSSEIDFFLPNPTGYQDDNNVTGNRSNLGDEMIYKFAGDDDVWVYVDGKLVLDMGGVHGKIYGEINFSTGEWKVIGNGASKVDNSPTIDYTYSDSSCLLDSDTLNLSEGDHTLTLYYLERGASQSNCAIYFNLAPRYQLRFAKKDSLTKNGLQGARFGVYADAACTVAADLKHWNETTNEFTSGGDGIVHAQGLAAGRTYYIKELQAPAKYPDMSGYVMALTLDSHGNPTITVPADAANMVDTSELQPVSGKDRTYKLNMVNGQPDMIYLPILNNSETSITATKTWSLLDGKAYRTFELDGKLITEYENSAASVKVQLQRYYEDNNSSEIVGNHTVQLVTQYFRSGSGTSNGDDASLAHYQTETRTVGDGGTVSFSLSTDTGAGIYSVVSTGGSLSANVTGTTEGKPFKVNGSSANRPNAGNYTVSNIRNDAVIYITVIGAANSEADLMGKVHLTGVQATNGDGTARRISRDTGFNDDPKDKNGEDIPDNGEVTLSKANGWTHTWQNLATVDGQGHRVYYYVVEKDPVTPQSAALGGASAFIRTTSSDGLSGGIITVQNSLRAVKVKLRKKDEQRHNGNDVPLQGAEFYIYTEEEYAKRNGQGSGTALTPSADLISPSEMGSPNGTKLVTDSYGRFYTGFLPQGVYYIVEEKAPDGYEPLNRHVKVVISETGMAYGDVAINEAGIPTVDLGGVNMTSQKPDASGIYNLYIADTVKKGGIKLQKLWKSDSDYGLTKACEGNDFALDENGKLYSKSDNGATAVLLSLGAVVNDALDADAVDLILDNPGSYGLSGKVVTVDGKKYIRLGKTDGVWPALEITNLPMKRHVRVQVTENGKTKDVERAVDVWYFIEEVGCYYDNNGTEVLAKVADKTDQWMVSYGWVNGEGDGTGKTQTIGGKTYCLIKARESHPDTLTVTNGMKGGLFFSKQDGRGNPVPGAVFQIIPNNAGAGNYMTGIDAMLTSGADGEVNISGLPIGIYWMWEKEAPAGYQKTDAMYCLMIGYTESRMYLVAGNEWPVASVVDNTPLGALKLTKTVQVDGAAPTAANRAKTTGVYTFAISGLGETDTQGIARTVSITFTDGRATSYQIDSDEAVPIPETEATDNSWTVTVPDLVPGTYTIQETLPQNGMTLKSVTAGVEVEGELAFVTVVAGDTAAEQVTALATFINNYGKADVKIVKIDENTRSEATQKRLSGAEFRLVKGDEDPQTHEVSYNAIYPNETEGVKQTGDTGELTFENLPDGHYRLQETGVPDGYVLTGDPYIYFTITEGALSWTDSSGAPITDGQEHNKVTCDMADKTYTVGNEPGVSLPNTGGHGTLPYTVGGTLLILCAIAIAVESRRRQKNTDWSN